MTYNGIEFDIEESDVRKVLFDTGRVDGVAVTVWGMLLPPSDRLRLRLYATCFGAVFWSADFAAQLTRWLALDIENFWFINGDGLHMTAFLGMPKVNLDMDGRIDKSGVRLSPQSARVTSSWGDMVFKLGACGTPIVTIRNEGYRNQAYMRRQLLL